MTTGEALIWAAVGISVFVFILVVVLITVAQIKGPADKGE